MGACCSSDQRVVFSSNSSNSYQSDDYDMYRNQTFYSVSIPKHAVMSEGEARSLYKDDASLTTKSHLELRVLLDFYPLGREFLLLHSRTAPSFAGICLHGWLDIQRFNAMESGSEKIKLAQLIYKKYVVNSVTVNEEEKSRISKIMLTARSDQIITGLFDDVKSQLFDKYNNEMFVKIRTTPHYLIMCATLRRKYNSIKHKDFVCHRVLGQGGHGLVLEVSKKSTGVRYAMKLLRKDDLLNMCGDEPWRANLEKRAMASCHHPFIVELYFAFRTSSMVGMVISLGTGLDLSKVLRASGPLSVEQVRFYAAEMTSALSYLHHQGLVYRDLKPANVLLNLDGHIQLTDFGCVCDISGKILPYGNNNNLAVSASPVFREEPLGDHDSNDDSDVTGDGAGVEAGVEAGVDSKSKVVGTTAIKKLPPLSRYWSTDRNGSKSSSNSGSSSNISINGSNGVGVNAGVNAGLGVGPDMVRFKLLVAASSSSASKVLLRLRKRFFELSEAEIVRHLLQCGCKYDKTVTHIEECLLWRQSYYTFTEKPNPNPNGPGCFLYTHGFDIEGHPLIVITTRLVNSSDPDSRNIPEILRWTAYMFECAIQRLPPHLEQFTVLSNRVGAVSSELEIANEIFFMLQKYYPCRMFKMLCYPVTTGLLAIGGIIKTIAGKEAKNFRFVKSLTELRNEIPDEYIPAEMGGSCTYEFNIDDYPAPAVCEPYQYCMADHIHSQHTGSDRNHYHEAEVEATKKKNVRGDNMLLSVDDKCEYKDEEENEKDEKGEENEKGVYRGLHRASASVAPTATTGGCQQQRFGRIGDTTVGVSALTSVQAPAPAPFTRPRALSITGTLKYMAPEMMILALNAPGYTHTGYTHAVDWWSLGVTMYRLLTFSYPFNTDIPKPETPEAKLTEWSDRYSTLLEEVDYSMFATISDTGATAGDTGAAGGTGATAGAAGATDATAVVTDAAGGTGATAGGTGATAGAAGAPDATAAGATAGTAGAAADVYADLVDIMSRLLTVAESDRLGYGPHGSSEVSRHKFFRDINWIELEKKQSKPPPLPDVLSSYNPSPEHSFRLEQILHHISMEDWLESASDNYSKNSEELEKEENLNDQLEFWDYISPSAARTELKQQQQKQHQKSSRTGTEIMDTTNTTGYLA